MYKPKILVIEDDPAITNLIRTTLDTQDYQYHTAKNGTGALLDAVSYNADVIILDLGLPDMDGAEIIQKVRGWSNVPIIVVSARSEDQDKVEALDAGADDYLTKPFNPLELVARVKSQLRRYYRLNPKVKAQVIEEISNIVTIEDLEVNLDTHEIFIDGKEVKLTPTEFDILVLLAKNRGKVFSISNIYESVWNQEFMESDNTVMVHIRKIREKIESDPRKPRFIKTVWGVGYKIEK